MAICAADAFTVASGRVWSVRDSKPADRHSLCVCKRAASEAAAVFGPMVRRSSDRSQWRGIPDSFEHVFVHSSGPVCLLSLATAAGCKNIVVPRHLQARAAQAFADHKPLTVFCFGEGEHLVASSLD